MATTLGEIMTRNPITVGLDAKLERVREIFEQQQFHHLLVVEGGELLGVLSDRDLLKNVSPFLATFSERPQDVFTLNKRVHQIMTRKPITATKETVISEAARLFIKHNISCLPIVAPDGKKVEGIVTLRDVLRWLMKDKDAPKASN